MKHTTSAFLIVIGLALQPANAQVSNAGGQVIPTGTAPLVVDPQVDFLGTKGATWKLVGRVSEPITPKLYGPGLNEFVLQLRKRYVTNIIFVGMSANLSHRKSHETCWNTGLRPQSSKTLPVLFSCLA